MALKALFASRATRWVLAGLTLLALLWLALNWPRWQARAQVATGFGARIACGCRYIEGRGLPSCAGDFKGLEGMGLVHFSDDPAARAVWASIPLLAKRKATFKSGYGCMPDKAG
ncbi:MAG: hypothetical protein J7494_09790 [Sphingobium sp.]|nr:hypothetical protein [Sphingobium sp.]